MLIEELSSYYQLDFLGLRNLMVQLTERLDLTQLALMQVLKDGNSPPIRDAYQ